MIPNLIIPIEEWEIKIKDNLRSGRIQKNPNKYNFNTNDNCCKWIGCSQKINRRRSSGLCDYHANHSNDLFLELIDSTGSIRTAPRHFDIIIYLLKWSSSRNYNLDDFFADISFSILGNVPDVSILDFNIRHSSSFYIPSLKNIWDNLSEVVEKYFPITNSSSKQTIKINLKGDEYNISIRVLAYTFLGLLICEEANRGDRWFCRNIIKDESKTTQFGAALALSYYPMRTFAWGVETENISKSLFEKLSR